MAAFSLAGYGGCSPKVVRVVDVRQHPSWNGEPREAVVEVWGPPQSEANDDRGGTILTYRKEGNASGRAEPAPGRSGVGSPFVSPPEVVTQYENYADGHVQARFWIDREGKVYRFEFSPSVFKKEPSKTVPPAAHKTPSQP